ncbi:MAG: hypothetical protein LUD51_00270 [Clostridia bacterium]|nr:hypothetical protein [Clostridia bacterium]
MSNLNCALSEINPHISIGWGLLGNLGDIPVDKAVRDAARRELQERFDFSYPYKGEGSRGPGAIQVARFYFDMTPGDLVLLFDGNYTRTVNLGVVTSQYYYGCRFGQDTDYVHNKNVCWVGQMPYAAFNRNCPKAYIGQCSVWSLDNYRDEILSLFSLNLERNAAKIAVQMAKDKANPPASSDYSGYADKADLKEHIQGAIQNDPQALVRTALAYEYGFGVPQDVRMARQLYEQAANEGNADAEYHLGLCYYHNRGLAGDLGTDKNRRAAAEWYEKAANHGNAKAQAALGNCYICGIGVGKDGDKGRRWFAEAALQNYPIAEYMMHVCYKNGVGVKKDDIWASSWLSRYQLAAGSGADSLL